MKCMVLLVLMCAGAVLAQPSDSWYRGGMRCPIQDIRADPVYTLGIGYVPPADAVDGKDWSLLEMDMNADLLYFRDVLLGDLDLRIDFRSVMPLNRGGLDLPELLLAFSLDTRWTWRYVNDSAIQIRVEPGFYTEAQSWNAASLSMPVSLTGIKTVNPTLSALAGMSLRPKFQRPVMPSAGVVWQPVDAFRLEALVPSGRAIYHISPDWSCLLFWNWESMTYQLPDDDDRRRRVTLESSRWGVGARMALSPEVRIGADVGALAGRSVEFHRGGKNDIGWSPYLRLSVGGAF